jgi:MFS family permease
MNRKLLLLTLAQGLFLINNVTFIAINGLVGLQLAPHAWMATLPVMGYVVGGALAAPLVARTQTRFGRRGSFQIGLIVALGSALLAAYAAAGRHFWLLMAATVIAGYYNANGQYRFAAAELVAPAGARKPSRWCWPAACWAASSAPTWRRGRARCCPRPSSAPTWRWRWWRCWPWG